MTLVKRIGGLRRFEVRAVRKFVVATVTRHRLSPSACLQKLFSNDEKSGGTSSSSVITKAPHAR